MTFNPDPNEQATEVIFSCKRKPINHPTLYFNNVRVATASVAIASLQKQLRLFLDGNVHLVII